MNSDKKPRIPDQVRQVILTDYATLIATSGGILPKFMLIALGIEFLGACLDKQHLNATARSEKRFNLALLKLFPANYHHFTKTSSAPYLYSDFRCRVIHQLQAEKSIRLCSHADRGELRHLTYQPDGSLVLVVEDFYRDLADAALKLINLPIFAG
jgi:hypothetical protein